MTKEEAEANANVAIATGQMIALGVVMLLICGLGCCWIENAYSVKRIEAATKGGVQYKIGDGLHHEQPYVKPPEEKK